MKSLGGEDPYVRKRIEKIIKKCGLDTLITEATDAYFDHITFSINSLSDYITLTSAFATLKEKNRDMNLVYRGCADSRWKLESSLVRRINELPMGYGVEHDLAVKGLEFADEIKGHYLLKNQFERSITSIGANIREANYAHSTADFISKFQIALKECYETEYWLELFIRSKITTKERIKEMIHDCGEIRRMLVASVTTLKNKL